MSVSTTTRPPLPEFGYRVPLMVFDVESIGLHGEGFAVGYIIVEHGRVTEQQLLVSHPDGAIGQPKMRKWIMEKVWPALQGQPRVFSMTALKEQFWSRWDAHRNNGGVLMADCPWPVEANFLSACIAADPQERYWHGPYPLLDAATLRAYGRARPTQDVHDPLQDALITWESIKVE